MAAKTPRGAKRRPARTPRKRTTKVKHRESVMGSEVSRLRGRLGFYHAHRRPNIPDVWWRVKILDFKVTGWGRLYLLVTPVGGRGKFWTEANRVTVGKRPPK